VYVGCAAGRCADLDHSQRRTPVVVEVTNERGVLGEKDRRTGHDMRGQKNSRGAFVHIELSFGESLRATGD
jgi:hypothetical protein